MLRRDWIAARAKVDATGCCRVCRSRKGVEAAHVVGRRADRFDLDGTPAERGEVLTVEPVRIVPLCGPATDFDTCHGKYDRHELDLLPYLDIEEQTQAVRDAGGIVTAYRRTTGESPA